MFATYKYLFQKDEWVFSCSGASMKKLNEIAEKKVQSNFKVYITNRDLVVVRDGLYRGVLYKPVFYGKIDSESNNISGCFSRSSLAKFLRGSWYTFIVVLLAFSLPVSILSIFMGSFGAVLIPVFGCIFLYASDRFFEKYQKCYEGEVDGIKAFLSSMCG